VEEERRKKKVYNLSWRRKKKESIFHIPPYEFEIGLYVNFGKLWNLKFQAK
jgi:hypothetical protein